MNSGRRITTESVDNLLKAQLRARDGPQAAERFSAQNYKKRGHGCDEHPVISALGRRREEHQEFKVTDSGT